MMIPPGEISSAFAKTGSRTGRQAFELLRCILKADKGEVELHSAPRWKSKLEPLLGLSEAVYARYETSVS